MSDLDLADRIVLALAAALLGIALAAHACPAQAPAPAVATIPAPLPELDRIEERLIEARAIVAHWRGVAHTQEPALTHCTDAALTRRVR